MRRPAAALALALAATTVHAAPQMLRGPLEPAAQGRMQCYAPDTHTKTCESMAAYRIDAAGAIQNTATLLFLEGTTVETTTPVAIQGDQVCGVIRPEDVAAARVMANDGGQVETAKTATVRQELKMALAPRFGQMICTAYVQTDAGLMAQATVDGERDEGLDRMIMWVSPADGYRVAP